MRDIAAELILARLRRDIIRNGGALLYTRGGVAMRQGGRSVESVRTPVGIAYGSWGVALAFAELGRSPGTRWHQVAKRLAVAGGVGVGRGAFDATESRLLGMRATGQTIDGPVTVDPAAEPGDLMNGEIGAAWLNLCLGFPPGEVPTPTDFGRVGIGHGRLGIAAVAAGAGSGEWRELTADRLAGGAWCNGLAGRAAASLLWYGTSMAPEARVLATETARRALRGRTRTDGLCHGRAGTLAVAAGVARVCDDGELMDRVELAADALSVRIQRVGLRLDSDRHADPSWLTGSAGVAWSLLCVGQRPLVNPLCPIDSDAWHAAEIQ